MKAKRNIPRLAAGELEMLQMLWRERGVTILEAQKALGLPIGYTTVQTRLNRLVKKGLAGRSSQRPAKYSASVTQDEVRRMDLDLLVDRVSEGQVVPLVAHLVNRDSLTRQELHELNELVAQAEQKVRELNKRERD